MSDRKFMIGNRMQLSESDIIPFKMASFALYKAREDDADGVYQKWRELLVTFDEHRSRIDPLADQNANLDILLRSFEDHLAAHVKSKGNLPDDSAGIQLHIQLSRFWVLGTYEFLRTLHLTLKRHDNPNGTCLKKTDSKGCGKSGCIVCSIGHLKNEVAIARTVIAKGESAGDVMNPPLTDSMKERLLSAPRDIAPRKSPFLVDGEGFILGTLSWFQHDKRIERDRIINRRELSDMILSWDASKGDADSPPV
jgi:hypothetical protein